MTQCVFAVHSSPHFLLSPHSSQPARDTDHRQQNHRHHVHAEESKRSKRDESRRRIQRSSSRLVEEALKQQQEMIPDDMPSWAHFREVKW